MIGRIVIVMRSPTFEEAGTVVERSMVCSASVAASLLRLKTCRQAAAMSAATPDASLTTKVCMEKTTLSSRRPFFNSP